VTGFRKILKFKFHENLSIGSRVVPVGWIYMTQLIIALRKFCKRD